MFRRAVLIVVLLALCAPVSFAGKKKIKGLSLRQNPDQHAELRNLPSIVAKQKCENFAWAAGVETILRMQGVSLDQSYWTDKINGGALCLPSIGDPDNVASKMSGDYVLPSGKKVHIEATYRPGAPDSSDHVLVPIALGRPYLVWWKGHAYVVTGVVWDEYIYPNGQKEIVVREMQLIDPYQSGSSQSVKFTNGTDDPSEISGMFEVTSTSLETSPWANPYNPAR